MEGEVKRRSNFEGHNMQRVMIIGSSGSGKSTLAKKLGKITKLPVIHIDKIYWKSGWVLRSADETIEMIESAAKAEQWIFDGNNTTSFECRISRADTLIFLDFPTYLCMYRVIMRLVKFKMGQPREDMAEGCPERFDWNFIKLLKWIYNYKRTGRWASALKFYNEVPDNISKYHFKNKKSVDCFLHRMTEFKIAG